MPDFPKEVNHKYLILSKARTHDTENMSAKRHLKATVFYDDRHLYCVRFHKIKSVHIAMYEPK